MGLIYVYLYRSVMFGWYIDTQTSVVSNVRMLERLDLQS